MWFFLNVTRRTATTTTLGILTVCATATSVYSAENIHPAPDDVVAAFQRAAEWVRDFDIPPADDDRAAVPIASATGVCMTLRLRGRVVATAYDFSGDDRAVRRATGRALSEVLGHPAVAALRSSPAEPHGLTEREIERRIGSMLTLDLEVAGALQPLPGRNSSQVARQLEPGIEGVAIRRGSRTAMYFPSQLLMMNRAGDIERMMPGLADQLDLRPAALSDLIGSSDVAVYGFRTLRLLQVAPGAAPIEVTRTAGVVAISEVTVDRLRDFASDLADHLMTHAWPDEAPEGFDAVYSAPPGFMGDYDPIADGYSQSSAGPVAQGLAALALLRFAAAPGVDAVDADRAIAIAADSLADIAEVVVGAESPNPGERARAAAALGLAIDALPADQRNAIHDDLERWARRALAEAVDPMLHGRTPDGLGAHGQSMVAAAVVRLVRDAPILVDEFMVTSVDLVTLFDHVWASAPARNHVALLPWMVWAERDLAVSSGRSLAHPELLVNLSRSLDSAQLRAGETEALDLVGGFDLSTAGVGPRCDSQSARPACAAVSMILMPELVPAGERFAALGRHLETMRFLIQLQADQAMLATIPRPERAVGGLRNALWDIRQPILAQSMGLLAAAETLRVLDEMASP